MSKFANSLKVFFFISNKPIEYDLNREAYTKLERDSSLSLDLESSKDRKILDILMMADKLDIQGSEYVVAERTFMLDGTALYISVKN